MRREPCVCLVVEVLVVTVAVIATLVASQHLGWARTWYIGPSVLVVGALLPTLIAGRAAAQLGLQLGRLREMVNGLCVGGVILAVFALGGVALLKRLGIEAPLRDSRPEQEWALWGLFQFIYTAFPEELFFRGYLVGNTSRLLRTVWGQSTRLAETVAVVFSAGVFALSHMLVLGTFGGIFTFIPGLIFGWLFVKIRSLIGPVVLHGAANVGYALIVNAPA